MLDRKGISLLDVIILILIVGVVAALIIPYVQKEKHDLNEATCRLRLKILAEAELNYFISGGIIEDTTTVDSMEVEDEEETEEEETVQHLYTDDINKLIPFIPDKIDDISIDRDTLDFRCPKDFTPYIFTIQDSIFYSITCPNCHGQVIKGALSWELK